MSGPYSPSPRRSQRGAPPESGTAISFDDWRADVDDRLERHDTTLQKTAVILERLSNRFDEHDRRIRTLEDAPKAEAQQHTTRQGLNLQTLSILVMVLAVVVSNVAPHLAWH